MPYCKPDQTQVFGVAREETVRISCEVVSNPVGSTSFEWRFNASDTGEMVDMPHDRFRSTNSKVYCIIIITYQVITYHYQSLSVSFPRQKLRRTVGVRTHKVDN